MVQSTFVENTISECDHERNSDENKSISKRIMNKRKSVTYADVLKNTLPDTNNEEIQKT